MFWSSGTNFSLQHLKCCIYQRFLNYKNLLELCLSGFYPQNSTVPFPIVPDRAGLVGGRADKKKDDILFRL